MESKVNMASSEHWRKKGNELYVSVKEGLAPTVKTERYKQAIQCYNRAFDMGKTEDDKTSAAKNIGMASWRLMKVHSESDCYSPQYRYTLFYHIKEAFKFFSFAYQHGFNVKPLSWVTGVLTSCRACWEDVATNVLDVFDIELRCQAIYDIAMAIEVKEVKSEAFLKLAECQFHRGIVAIQDKDYKKCLNAMRECYMPINEAGRISPEEQIQTEVRVLEQDVLMHTCMAESMQARDIGDALFEKVLRDEESLNIDMVWEVIDWYKQACIRTRDITEVELEAISLSRLGRVYGRVLKLKYKAKEYYKLAIQLAHSMYPRTFVLEDWFQEATTSLAEYQSETVQAEEERKAAEKKEVLKTLEKEIKLLDSKVDVSHDEFLKFVYNKFPPKDKSKKLVLPKQTESDRLTKIKKTLQKAVVHYHPDSIDEKLEGQKWKVLSEEITKCLTRRYETMKG
ncbi:uncharacterized protein LOC128239523 isoform X2 [Mya arenaria]|nr:uncharacterized protein LOC128239523 isoform X2 [Mya arenaria]